MFGGVELMFLAREPDQGGARRLAAAAHRRAGGHGDDDLAARAGSSSPARRAELEGPLDDFIEELRADPVTRVPGTAVFPHPTKETAPLALRANVEFNHVLHEHVVIVSVTPRTCRTSRAAERLDVDELGYTDDGIVHVSARFGFQDEQDIPTMLREPWG